MSSTHASSYVSKVDGWLAVIMVAAALAACSVLLAAPSPKDRQGFLAELKVRREATA